MKELIKASKSNLLLIKKLVEQLEDSDLSTKLDVLSSSTIGEHIRHIIEFYQCLIDSKDGIVIYDARDRDLSLETNKKAITSSVNKISSKLSGIVASEKITVLASFSETDEKQDKIASTKGRELACCLDHTIHHLAIIKMAVKVYFKNIQLPENFGVAYSTIRYRNEELCVQ